MTAPATQCFELKPTGLPKRTVEGLGEKVAAKLLYKPGAELEPIVQRLGGEVREQTWDEATDGGSLIVCPAQKSFEIRISPYAGKLRNRFTIAHELGHYFLHTEVGKLDVSIDREGTGPLEWEANWFAAGFLLPSAQFAEDWKRSRGNVGKLIGIYQVSEPVITIRRDSLGLK